MTSTQPLIIELLLQKGLLEPKKMEALREAQAKDNMPLEGLLVKKELVSDQDIAQAYADYLVLPLFEPEASGADVDRALGRLLPEKLCRDQWIAPVAMRGDTLELAFVSPDEMLIIDEVQLLTGLTIRPVIARRSVVEGVAGRALRRPGLRPASS